MSERVIGTPVRLADNSCLLKIIGGNVMPVINLCLAGNDTYQDQVQDASREVNRDFTFARRDGQVLPPVDVTPVLGRDVDPRHIENLAELMCDGEVQVVTPDDPLYHKIDAEPIILSMQLPE